MADVVHVLYDVGILIIFIIVFSGLIDRLRKAGLHDPDLMVCGIRS